MRGGLEVEAEVEDAVGLFLAWARSRSMFDIPSVGAEGDGLTPSKDMVIFPSAAMVENEDEMKGELSCTVEASLVGRELSGNSGCWRRRRAP